MTYVRLVLQYKLDPEVAVKNAATSTTDKLWYEFCYGWLRISPF